MNKKALSILLCLMILVTLSGCFADTSEDNGPDTTTESNPEKTTEKSTDETMDEKIDDMIEEMTLEEKVGQMFMVRCPNNGDDISAVSDYHLGGYILFAVDFASYTTDEVKSHITTYQSQGKIPLLIGVDEEGGTVNRISTYPQFRDSPFPSPRSLFVEGGLEAVKSDAKEKFQLLKDLGINVNFAPVCDISTDPNNFMYDRSLGQSPEIIGEYVKSVVEIGLENNIGSVLKHFPGYGSDADTHTGIAYDDRSLESFKNSDFIPFETGITGGNCCILVAHNIVNSMDPDMPASLSDKVHDILRDEIGFDGVIMTDDLSMGAITQFCGSDAAAVTAVNAGNDMLCCDDYTEQIPAVISKVNSGDIQESRIDESVHRILKWKYDLGLLNL